MAMVPAQTGKTNAFAEVRIPNNESRGENKSAASAEKARNSLGKTLRNLALGAIPLAALAFAGDIYSGGALSAALVGVGKSLIGLNLGELFSANTGTVAGNVEAVAQNLGNKAAEISSNTQETFQSNLDPGMANAEKIVNNPAATLDSILKGQGVTATDVAPTITPGSPS